MEIKIVLVKHPNVAGVFAFRVPEDKFIETGSYVLCDTKKGKDQIGRCITPSFEIEKGLVEEFYGASAEKLKPVTCLLVPFRYADKKTEPQTGETDAEGQDN